MDQLAWATISHGPSAVSSPRRARRSDARSSAAPSSSRVGSGAAQGDGAGCLLSLAAWELGLDDGESLMRRSVDAVRVPALFDAWWGDLLEREGDVIRARRTARELIGGMLHRSLADAPLAREATARAGAPALERPPVVTW